MFDFADLHSWAQRIVNKDFAGVITGSLPGPRLTVAEASESLFGLEDPGDQKRTLLPGDDPLLLRLGSFRMLRLSFF